MCRLRTYLPSKGLIIYYNGYILPLFDYCCTVWGETTHLNLEKQCKLHRRAPRIILNGKYDIPSLQLFKTNLVGCLLKIDMNLIMVL